jgi:hypothetical protein
MDTKELVARQPMRYERRDLVAGQRFTATVVDASYLMRTGRADPYVAEEHDDVPDVPDVAAVRPRPRGRPRRAPTTSLSAD